MPTPKYFDKMINRIQKKLQTHEKLSNSNINDSILTE